MDVAFGKRRLAVQMGDADGFGVLHRVSYIRG